MSKIYFFLNILSSVINTVGSFVFIWAGYKELFITYEVLLATVGVAAPVVTLGSRNYLINLIRQTRLSRSVFSHIYITSSIILVLGLIVALILERNVLLYSVLFLIGEIGFTHLDSIWRGEDSWSELVLIVGLRIFSKVVLLAVLLFTESIDFAVIGFLVFSLPIICFSYFRLPKGISKFSLSIMLTKWSPQAITGSVISTSDRLPVILASGLPDISLIWYLKIIQVFNVLKKAFDAQFHTNVVGVNLKDSRRSRIKYSFIFGAFFGAALCFLGFLVEYTLSHFLLSCVLLLRIINGPLGLFLDGTGFTYRRMFVACVSFATAGLIYWTSELNAIFYYACLYVLTIILERLFTYDLEVKNHY